MTVAGSIGVKEPRIYVYKIPWDTARARCVTPGTLSLAICKPAIRRTASEGDYVFAFGVNDVSQEVSPNRLVYVAVVTKRLTDGAYYESALYQRRGDCIYRRQKNGKFVLRDDARYHFEADSRPRDIGDPPDYRNANVLVSNDFRYFGGSGTDDWKSSAPELKRLIERMGQGHRVYHRLKIREQLLSLKDQVWDDFDKKVLGKPLHATKQPCDVTDNNTLEIGVKKCSYIEDASC